MKKAHRSFLVGGLPLALVVIASCTSDPDLKPRGTVATSGTWGERATEVSGTTAVTFVGNDACQPCHASEFALHAPSRHRHTLREATPAELGRDVPAPGKLPAGHALRIDAGQLKVEGADKTPLTLQLALGAGKTGITFLTLFAQSSAEFQQSYFPALKTWLPTPGQEKAPPGQVKRSYPETETRRCLSCHAVVVPQQGLLPEKRFFGVGCESCHGPGSAHVAVMRAGGRPKGLGLVALGEATGTGINQVCGRCHRGAESMAGTNALEKQSTQRFQPYGLSLSACFKKSSNQLSCVTCHNPHADASTDPKGYEKTCLSCHSTPQQKACPVNPKEKCIACHMPTRKVFPGTNYPIAMADHYIRIFREHKVVH